MLTYGKTSSGGGDYVVPEGEARLIYADVLADTRITKLSLYCKATAGDVRVRGIAYDSSGRLIGRGREVVVPGGSGWDWRDLPFDAEGVPLEAPDTLAFGYLVGDPGLVTRYETPDAPGGLATLGTYAAGPPATLGVYDETWLTGSFFAPSEWTPVAGRVSLFAAYILTATAFADELYERLDPFHADDAENGYALQSYTGALGEMFRQTESYAREGEDGSPSWAALVSPSRAPDDATLRWMAQLAGVRLAVGLTRTAMQAQLAQAEGRRRGTPGYLKEVAQRYLTGTKTVVLNERVPDAYGFQVFTRTSETPDPDTVMAALIAAAKPAALQMEYIVAAGYTYDDATDTYNAAGAVTYDQSTSTLP